MDPVTIGLLAGGALGLAGQQQSAKTQSEQYKKARQIIDAVPLPILKEYYPDLYQQVMNIVPEAEAAQMMGPSAYEKVTADPALKQAQMNALIKMQQIGDQGGMTATDQARLAQIQQQTEGALKGQQGAIMQNLATRGLSGGMTELVARNQAAQEAANRQAQQGLDVKAQAEQRALQAIMQSGQLGGQMNQQDIAQQQALAQARDAISKFNVANVQDVGQRNVAARNQAQQMNQQNQQNIANLNVGQKNQAQQYNLNIPQQQYANQMAKATGQATGLQQQANLGAQNQAAQNQMIGGLIGTGAQYYAGQQQQQNYQDWLNAQKNK